MLACWEGPSAGLFQQNGLMLLNVTVMELNVFPGNVPGLE